MPSPRLIAVMMVMIMTAGPTHGSDPCPSEPSSSFTYTTTMATGDLVAGPLQLEQADCWPPSTPAGADRLWLLSTRHLSSDACTIDLTNPQLRVARLDPRGSRHRVSLESFFSQLHPERPLYIHIHGNRMTEDDAYGRGRFIYRYIKRSFGAEPLDYMIFSWPSERTGLLLRDGRIKAERTEAQGLYLAWLLRELVIRDVPVVLVGYSFGGRVATGSLHALAGGSLGGRRIPGDSIRGADVGVALVAPAVEEDWLEAGNYHGLASQNIREMALFYNPRDAILKRYWLIDLATRGRALGFSGPRRLAPGFDGTPVRLVARNCAPFLGVRHSEVEYYTQRCQAGRTIGALGHNARRRSDELVSAR